MNIDEYRKLAKSPPHYHGGLGCIKLPMKDGTRAHFYSDRAPFTTESGGLLIHDHMVDFSAVVMRGKVRNTLYEVRDVSFDSGVQLIATSCDAGEVPEVISKNVVLLKRASFDTAVGGTYWLWHCTFHEFDLLASKVITHVRQTMRMQPRGHFVQPKSETWVCAFESPMSHEECWSVIEYTLDDH